MEPFNDRGFSDFLSEIDPRASEEYERKKREQERIRELQEATDIRRGLGAPTSSLGKVVDILSRGNYASAKFYNTMFNEEGNLLAKAWRGFSGGIREAINPEERLTFKDVIAEANPLWAASNPYKTSLLGFMGDVVVDPINAISFGTGGVLKSAVRMTSRAGKIVPLGKPGVQIFREIVEEGVQEGLEPVIAKQRAVHAMQEIIDPTTDFKAPEVTRYERTIRHNRTRTNIVRAAEDNSIPPGAGIFMVPQSRVGDIAKKGKLFEQTVDPTTLRGLATSTQEAVYRGTPRIQVDVLENYRYIGNKASVYGAKKKDRLVGVIVPEKYIVDETVKKAGGPSKRWASTALDINDLRFVTDDTDKLMNFAELRRHTNIRNLNRADEVMRIKAAQRTGKEALQRRNLEVSDLIDPGGLKILGKSVVTTDQFKHLFRTVGGTTAFKAMKDLPGVKELQIVAKGLQKTFGLHGIIEKHYPEWMRFRRMLEVRKREALLGLKGTYHKVFKTDAGRVLDTKEREGITEFLGEVSAKLKEELDVIGTKKPTPQLEAKVFQDMFNSSKLSMDQKAAVIKLRQAYNDFDLLEQEAGLVKGYFLGYNPQRYEAINRVARYRDLRKWQTERLSEPMKGTDTFVKPREFKSKEEALAHGFKPIEDAGRLYLMRFMEHNAALRKNEWEGFIKNTYGKNVPEAIEQDLVRLGEKFYAPGYGEAGRLGHQLFHDINRIFRASATIVRPAFALKQVFGNLSQVFVEMGRDAMKVVDPTTLSDAVRFVSSGKVNMDIKTPFGYTMKAAEIEAALSRNPVLKNLSIEGLGLVQEHQAIKRLTNDLFTRHNNAEYKTTAAQGLRNIFTNAYANYLNWPAYVEDTFRVGTFIGALKAGHSEAAAMEIVDRALFNYTTGLTRWEQSIRNGVIPFYTFQKFGLTLLGKAMGTAPGRVAAMPKIGKQFYETWNKIANGDTLTDNERKVLPGYLLEQPNVFEKFRKVDGQLEAIFRTFNSMTLLDVVNMFQLNDKGEIDYGETLTKGGLAQLAPFWKVPLETLVFKRELFSDKALEGVYAGRLGDIDYDKFARNLGAATGLSLTAGLGMTPQVGIGGGVAGGLLGKLASLGPAEEVVKWLINWEEGVNPRTGRREVYINPYLLQVSKSFLPGLNTAIKLSREDETRWDGILYAAFGVGTTHLDLKQEGVNKVKSFRYDYHDRVRAYRKYMQQGRLDKADIARQELRELLEYNSQEVQDWIDPTIRGGAIPEEDF